MLRISDLREIAEDLANTYLAQYTKTIRHNGRKEINDALWGTISLTPIEVAIIDSPLLQRLRNVKQLGVAHWVYPSAIHSRFEHTLGVLHQIQQLIIGLNSAPQSSDQHTTLIDTNKAQLLRICALLHDIGHAAFSHVSEKALEGLPAFRTLSSEFANDLNRETPGEDKQLSEMLAYYIVRSPAMRELLDILLKKHRRSLNFKEDHEENLEYVIDSISRALIGRKIDDNLPLLHELISGPFDADKLDYLARDARLAGIPSLLDIPRLIQKLSVAGMPANKLPQDIAGRVSTLKEHETAWLFGIKMSAKSVLDELQLARVLSYAKIYRHPKVIAIEQMIRAFIVGVSTTTTSAQLLKLLYSWPDDSILGLKGSQLCEALGLDRRKKGKRLLDTLKNAESALQAIRERRLWVRAFQLNSPDIYGNKGPEPDEMANFREEINHPDGCEAFLKTVRDETHKLIQLNLIDPAKAPNRIALDSCIMIRVLSSSSGATQTGRAYLISGSSNAIQLGSYMELKESWVESYMTDQPRALIFCPPEIADIVYLAVERAAWTRHKTRLPDYSSEISKRDIAVLWDYKAKVPAEYWSGIPYDLRPAPARMKDVDITNTIGVFNEIRLQYQEPDPPQWITKLKAKPVKSDKRTKTWLHQFGTDELVECAAHLLKNFRILTRDDTTTTLKEFFRSNPNFEDAWVVPFGGAKDSSAVQAYLGAHIGNARTGSLDEYARHKDGKPLIFLDDFIGSGGQATDILATWFNRSDLRKDLGEERETLTPEIAEYLSKCEIAFVFVSGWAAGLNAVKNISEKLGLKSTVFCYINEDQIPFAEKCLLGSFPRPTIDKFLKHCGRIGKELLQSEPGTEITENKLDERALGYGNKGMLMASLFNTPTQTLTAIWASGIADGTLWSPLLRRRKKI